MAAPQKRVDADFLRGDTVKIARALLGAELCRRFADGKITRLPIMETEAYDGFSDKASHASKGKTARTRVMFGEAGHWYVYLCYGIHWMLNIVTREVDYPAAVLIRAAGSCDGPAKLTKALGIDKSFNETAALPQSGLWLEWSASPPAPRRIKTAPRVGIDYAGPVWSQKPWRFILKK